MARESNGHIAAAGSEFQWTPAAGMARGQATRDEGETVLHCANSYKNLFLESCTIGFPEFLSLAVGLFFIFTISDRGRSLLGRSGGRFASNGAANVSSCPPSLIPPCLSPAGKCKNNGRGTTNRPRLHVCA